MTRATTAARARAAVRALRELTRRRLGGAVLLLAGLVIGVVVLVSVLGDDEPDRPPPAERRIAVPPLGLAVTQPVGWERTIERRVIRLRSPDRSIAVTVSSPIAGRRNGPVKAALRRGLLRGLAPARVIADRPGRLGTRRVTSIEVMGGRRGRRVRALGIVESTPYRTYAVTVVSPAQPSRRLLLQVRRILDSVALSRPVPARRGR